MPTIDWFAVLSDLRRCGFSLRTIAKRTGITYFRLYSAKRGDDTHRVRAGGDLRHRDGERLLQLWSEITQRDPNEAPMLQENKTG